MPDYNGKTSDTFLIDLMVVMVKAVWLSFNKIPRCHQMICLWFNLHSKKTILEVKTGEGKTMVVAMTALYFALRGKKVDVFTSSSTLAQTETKPDSLTRKLFNIFDISLADNCS
jgi:preprotein translocase subunit SecA